MESALDLESKGPALKLYYPVTKILEEHIGISDVVIDDITTVPAPYVLLKTLWKVPVVYGHKGLDAVLQQRVYQTVVVVHSFFVHLLGFGGWIGDNSCPCYRETVKIHLC